MVFDKLIAAIIPQNRLIIRMETLAAQILVRHFEKAQQFSQIAKKKIYNISVSFGYTVYQDVVNKLDNLPSKFCKQTANVK